MCIKLLIIIDINSTKEINQFQERCEIQTSIIVQVNTVEIFQCMNGSIYSINPCMGQLIFLVVATICNWNIGITRGCCQENLFSFTINCHNDIDIRTRNRTDRTVSINSTDINVETVTFDIFWSFNRLR